MSAHLLVDVMLVLMWSCSSLPFVHVIFLLGVEAGIYLLFLLYLSHVLFKLPLCIMWPSPTQTVTSDYRPVVCGVCRCSLAEHCLIFMQDHTTLIVQARVIFRRETDVV